jgi:hypothetical protein
MLNVEPLAGNCRSNIRFVLVIGRNDLDALAADRLAELSGGQSRGL